MKEQVPNCTISQTISSIYKFYHWRQDQNAPSSDTSLSNAETLRLFSQLLDAKFDQKFATFKRDLEDKEATTQSELKMLKIESKAANSFTFKGNKVQCELNVSLHDLMDGAIKNISKGNLSAAISELESVKTLLTKRNKLIRFADKSRAGWTAVEEYESDELAGDSEDERKLRSAERRALAKIREKDRHRLPELAIQVPVSHRVKFLLLGLPILSLLIRNFFVGSPFASVDLNLQTSASVAGREATGQIQLPAQAALEEPLQFLQATRPQTDDKLKSLTWLGNQWDLKRNLLFIPVEELDRLLASIDSVLLQSRLPARQLASVNGSIISNILVFGNVCKLMTKSLHRALDRRRGWDSCVELDPCARKELEFWKNNVSNLNSRSFLNTVRKPSRIFYSDASATGCAAFIAIDDTPVPRFYSKYFNPDSLGVDSLAHIPYWPSAYYWPLLVERGGVFKSFVADCLYVENGTDVFLHGGNKSSLFGSENFSGRAFALKIAHLKDSELRKLAADLPLRTIEAKAPSTTDRCSRAFKKFREWSSPYSEVVCLPTDELSVALYFESMIQGGSPYSALESACYGVNWAHNLYGFQSPCDSKLVKNVLEAAKRSLAKPVSKKEPVTPALIVDICNRFAGPDANLSDLRLASLV
ncbi:hypothetical protein P5673_011997 [Acropora cervicornis]|uniref:Uncharacterized protein n=1 Tax=Acropora cervicornis TaxID=6130 RepID=A0AAD9QNF5_ACRCE|nr:hypothetical protein P5673_011997 [Acropora cervicornis]